MFGVTFCANYLLKNETEKRFRENNKLWLCWQFVKANNIMWIKLNGEVPSHSLASSLPFVNKLNILSFGQLPVT